MPDLRDVLRQGADVTTGLPDMPAVWTRAVRQRRRRRAVGAGGAALCASAVTAVIALVGAELDPRPDPPPRPATTPRLAPAQPLPAYPGPLEPGLTYDARELDLAYDFTVPGRGWSLAAREPGWLSLHRGENRLNLQRWDRVYDATRDRLDDTATQAVPADLTDWLTRHPRLEVRPQPTVTLAGQDWQALEVSVTRPLATPPPECGAAPCVLLGRVGAEPVDLLATERARIYLRSDDAGPVVLLVSFPDSSDGPGSAVTRLVDSLHERPLP